MNTVDRKVLTSRSKLKLRLAVYAARILSHHAEIRHAETCLLYIVLYQHIAVYDHETVLYISPYLDVYISHISMSLNEHEFGNESRRGVCSPFGYQLLQLYILQPNSVIFSVLTIATMAKRKQHNSRLYTNEAGLSLGLSH